MTSANEIYGLVGRSLGHSFSQRFFTQKFADELTDAAYLNFAIDSIDNLPEIIHAHADRLRGLNVTIPYKTEVMALLDRIDPAAAEIGAVNTIAFSRDPATGRLSTTGFNTDVVGFRESLRPMLRPADRYALVLGSGGASKAVVAALRQLGITPTVVSRTPREGVITYADLDAATVGRSTVIVNATPLGTWPDTDALPPFPYDLLGPDHICHDLVYNPAMTAFMREAAARGAAVKNGLEMLRLQALAAWEIWQANR